VTKLVKFGYFAAGAWLMLVVLLIIGGKKPIEMTLPDWVAKLAYSESFVVTSTMMPGAEFDCKRRHP
jgi:hypothetical protein